MGKTLALTVHQVRDLQCREARVKVQLDQQIVWTEKVGQSMSVDTELEQQQAESSPDTPEPELSADRSVYRDHARTTRAAGTRSSRAATSVDHGTVDFESQILNGGWASLEDLKAHIQELQIAMRKLGDACEPAALTDYESSCSDPKLQAYLRVLEALQVRPGPRTPIRSVGSRYDPR